MAAEKCVIKETSQPHFQRGTTVRKALTVQEAIVDHFKSSIELGNSVSYKNLDGTEFEFPGSSKIKKFVSAVAKVKEKEPLKVKGPITEDEEKEQKNAKERG